MIDNDYECHITIKSTAAKRLLPIAKGMKWKVSKIKGDPILGNRKIFLYATKHDISLIALRVDMTAFCSRLGYENIVRRKIEKTMLDERFNNESKRESLTSVR